MADTKNGGELTAEEMRTLADKIRNDPDVEEDDLYDVAGTLLEALAKTKEDLVETVRLLADTTGELLQLRKEFEALKSQIVRKDR